MQMEKRIVTAQQMSTDFKSEFEYNTIAQITCFCI